MRETSGRVQVKDKKMQEPVMFETKSVDVEIKEQRMIKFINYRNSEVKYVRADQDLVEFKSENGMGQEWIQQ